MAILFNNCKQMRMTNAFNQRLRGMLMESAQGVHSTTKGESRKRTEESLLSSGRFRLFPATGAGGRQVARVTPSLTQ